MISSISVCGSGHIWCSITWFSHCLVLFFSCSHIHGANRIPSICSTKPWPILSVMAHLINLALLLQQNARVQLAWEQAQGWLIWFQNNLRDEHWAVCYGWIIKRVASYLLLHTPEMVRYFSESSPMGQLAGCRGGGHPDRFAISSSSSRERRSKKNELINWLI